MSFQYERETRKNQSERGNADTVAYLSLQCPKVPSGLSGKPYAGKKSEKQMSIFRHNMIF